MKHSADRRIPPPVAHRRSRTLAALLAALALCAAGCAETARDAAWPEGALCVGRTAALRSVLEDLQRLEATPLARAARDLAAALPACERFESHAGSGQLQDLAASLRCGEPAGALGAVHRALGDGDLLLALPTASGGRARLGARVDARNIRLAVDWPDAPADGALGLLLPGDAALGSELLSDRQRVLHLHVRPASGLDLAALVPAHSQADRLFRLRSALFAGAALDGSWEAAVYLPEPERAMPRAALALEFGVRRAAVLGIEQFIEEIASTWPVRRSDFALGGAPGACLLNLNILPEFAPCYVATARALVIGWNAASLASALAEPIEPAPVPDGERAAGSAVLDFRRVRDADALLASALGPDGLANALQLPWRRLVASGSRADHTLRARIEIERETSP
ncbi:MAG: hypothetical protein OEM49_06745 [Myxococcales bacterium]|nr:hypothetical protein [Myxococcales bacterium]MDH5306288.1 hypothetical protein [Myxococcales bacterium]MDH5565045.1 hypothetical protein [Myxococcales bacterium]